MLAGVSVGSQPADACCNYGYYAPAPVVVQPYYNGCGGCGGCGSAYYGYGAGYGYGYGVGAAGYDYAYGGAVAVVPRYYGYGWRRGCCGY